MLFDVTEKSQYSLIPYQRHIQTQALETNLKLRTSLNFARFEERNILRGISKFYSKVINYEAEEMKNYQMKKNMLKSIF